jgi:hypothetical protein
VSDWYRMRERHGIWIVSYWPINWKGWLHLTATVVAFYVAMSQGLTGGVFPQRQDIGLIVSALVFSGLLILGLIKTKIVRDFSN